MAQRIECTVRGRVQMVMFRDFARRAARSLGLTGFVKNNADGTVAVVAEGPQEKLEQFAARLKEGPLFARVDSLDVRLKEATGEFFSFEILF